MEIFNHLETTNIFSDYLFFLTCIWAFYKGSWRTTTRVWTIKQALSQGLKSTRPCKQTCSSPDAPFEVYFSFPSVWQTLKLSWQPLKFYMSKRRSQGHCFPSNLSLSTESKEAVQPRIILFLSLWYHFSQCCHSTNPQILGIWKSVLSSHFTMSPETTPSFYFLCHPLSPQSWTAIASQSIYPLVSFPLPFYVRLIFLKPHCHCISYYNTFAGISTSVNKIHFLVWYFKSSVNISNLSFESDFLPLF